MAHKEFFGDAYQYVHRVLLESALPARDEEGWIVHPMMFRNNGGGLEIGDYAGFLGVDEGAVLERDGNDQPLSSPIQPEDVKHRPGPHVFLDPDTGIDLGNGGKNKNKTHVSAWCLARIANQAGRRIVMTFDHAYPRIRVRVDARTYEGPRIHDGACGVRRRADENFDVLCGPCRAAEQVHQRVDDLWQKHRIHSAAIIVRASPCVCYVFVSTECAEVAKATRRIYDTVPVPEWFRIACPCPD